MIRYILESIPGISAFPIIGLVIFMAVFAGIAVWVFFFTDKRYLEHMKELPLESSRSSSTNGD